MAKARQQLEEIKAAAEHAERARCAALACFACSGTALSAREALAEWRYLAIVHRMRARGQRCHRRDFGAYTMMQFCCGRGRLLPRSALEGEAEAFVRLARRLRVGAGSSGRASTGATRATASEASRAADQE